MSTSEQIDELYEIIQPILDAGDPAYAYKIRQNWQEEAPGILSWAVDSGYFLWTRYQPKPLDPEKVRAFLKEWQKYGKAYRERIVAQIEANKAKIAANERELTREKQEASQLEVYRPISAILYQKDKRPLLERYYKNHQFISEEESQLAQLITREAVFYQVIQAKKYRFSVSALQMCLYLLNPYLRANQHPEIATSIPAMGTWIEFELSLAGGADRGVYDVLAALHFYPITPTKGYKAACKALSIPEHSKLFRSVLDQITEFEASLPGNCWAFECIGPDGAVIWQRWLTNTGTPESHWILRQAHICPTQECEIAENDGETVRYSPCANCKKIDIYYLSLLKVALLMISGAFAERDEAPVYETAEDKIIRKLPREDKPHKFREAIHINHYSIVTFDACKKKVPILLGEQQESRGSWVEAAKAIDPDAIIYVEHHIAKTQRTLRHERYVHKRGQTIDVNAHDKRIPMKVSELRRKITRVVASKYEAMRPA